MTKFNFSFLFALLLGSMIVQAQATFFSENFDGGLPADWMAVEEQGNGATGSNWNYTTTGAAGSFATPALASPSASNGWMIFDSDLNCSGNQDAWLISPAINAADKNVVFLEFYTLYASFLDDISVQVSTDLENWTEFLIFPTIAGNDYAGGGTISSGPEQNPFLVSLNISSAAAGESNFYIAFRFLSDSSFGALGGCGYNWQIDDITVTDVDPRPANDLMVNPFYAIAHNYATPASQVESFGFLADIENNGSSAQTGANLNVSIINDATGTNVFSTDLAYPAFEIDQLIENVFFPDAYVPAAETGTFTGTYNLTLDGQTDDVPDNNARSFSFVVSDTLFSKGATANTATRPVSDESYSWGNVYYVPNGAGYYARYMSFGYANPSDAAGHSITTFLFKWDGDTNGDGLANEDEYGGQPIAFNSIELTGNEADNQIFTIPVDLDGNAIELEDDSYYIVVTRFETNNETALFQLATDNQDYAALNFMSDSLGMARYAGALDVGNTNDYSLIGFGFDTQPFVTLSVSDNPNLTSITTLLGEENKIELAPNPVHDELRLDLNFANLAENVSIEIYDVAGRSLLTEQYTKLSTQSMVYNVSQWQSGTYFLRIRTEKGIRTKRFIIQ